MTSAPANGLARLDERDILRVLFHPQREMPWSTPENGRAVAMFGAQGPAVGGWLFPAADPAAPLILLFHGNGEIAVDYADIGAIYQQLGLALLVMDYRGYGRSEGTPSATGLVEDAIVNARALPELLAMEGLKPVRTLVMGRSLGSAAALAVATDPDAAAGLSGLILESAFADTFALVARLGGPRVRAGSEAEDGFGQLTRIAQVTLPTLIIHGVEDQIIPIDDALALLARSPAARKQLVSIPDAGHNDLMFVGAEAYFTAIRELAVPS